MSKSNGSNNGNGTLDLAQPVNGLVIDETALLALVAASKQFAHHYWVVNYVGPEGAVKLVARYASNAEGAARATAASLTPQAEGTGGRFDVNSVSDDPNRVMGMLAGEKTLASLFDGYRKHANTRVKIIFTAPDGAAHVLGDYAMAQKAQAEEKAAELKPLFEGTRGKVWIGLERDGELVSAAKKLSERVATANGETDPEKVMKKRMSAALWRENKTRKERGLPRYTSYEEMISAKGFLAVRAEEAAVTAD